MLKLTGLANVTPEGRLSVNVTPVALTLFALVMVNVRRDVVPAGIEVGEKALAKVGAVAVTVSVASADVLFPRLEVSVIAGLV